MTKNKDADGSEDLAAAINTLHKKMLFIIDRSISKHGMSSQFNAEDVFQETVVSLLRQNQTFSDVKDVQGYLISAANNRMKSMMRSMLQKKRTISRNVYFSGDPGHAAPQLTGEESLLRSEDVELVIELVETRLPVDQRRVIQMYYFDEMSISQIAEITGKTRNSVAALAKRARQRLRELLGTDQCKEETTRSNR